VLLDAKAPVQIEWCDVRVEGTLDSGRLVEPIIVPLAARLCEHKTLPIGTSTLRGGLTLPNDAPPSLAGRISYSVAVHASVPWWPDMRSQFALSVASLPPERPFEGQARVGISRAEGPRAGTPYGEIAIASDVFEVGGVIDGRAAMRDMGTASTKISLVAYERFGSLAPSRSNSWAIALPPGSEAFALTVPSDITPTIQSSAYGLGYRLQAEARSGLLETIIASVPVRIVPRGSAKTTARLVAPHVGDVRLEELFTQVGASEGASVEAGPALVVRRGGVVGRATRELVRDGTRIAVEVTYPSLHLDLRVSEPTLIVLAPKDRRVAQRAGLGPRCAVAARDDEQASAYLATLATPLAPAKGIDMSDTTLRYFVPSPASDRTSLATIVRDMQKVVASLASPPPLPTAIAHAQDAWTELAHALDGELETGHARLVATNVHAAIEIETLFGSEGPNGTLVVTRPTRELGLDAPFVHERGEPPAELSPEARGALDRLSRFGTVSVDASEIRVTLDGPLGRVVPPSRGQEVVEASLRLAAALRPSAGPFR